MFTAFGPQWITEVVEQGFPVFLDLKYHDIPNTVAKACLAAGRLGVQILNVHASGGLQMMRAAQEAISTLESPPLLIAVTVLTSLTPEDMKAIGFFDSINIQAQRLALLTQKAGLGGVVCSAEEAQELRRLCGPNFKLITPGIRLSPEKTDDQHRIMTPEAAIKAGSDILVIGRPITQASNPLEVVREIHARIDYLNLV